MGRDDEAPGTAAELVRRIRAGDAAAESELVSRYCRGVMILIRRASSDPSAVDDLYQQTFHIALEKIRREWIILLLDRPEPQRFESYRARISTTDRRSIGDALTASPASPREVRSAAEIVRPSPPL